MGEVHEETGERAGHVQQRSFAPVVIAIGIFLINLGFVAGIVVGLLGVAVLASGVAIWVREDMRYFRGGPSHGD